MANPQTQANTPQETKAAEKGKTKKQRREPSRLTWWWRFFWMRRSGARTVWALILAIPALLIIVYLALSASDQTQVVAAIQAAAQIVGQTLGPTGLRVGLEMTLLVFALASLALVSTPGYRQYRYLHLPTKAIPPITIYVDAENIGNTNITALVKHLREDFLQGKRAKLQVDLLFFMDALDTKAGQTNRFGQGIQIPKWRYELLYKYGFRLINSPKLFTGTSPMAEAADRELALHALERALVGGKKQEFVIVSGDGDYPPLIYRLVSLGHSVQMWMWGGTRAYRDAANYLPSSLFTVYNLETGKYITPQEPSPAIALPGTFSETSSAPSSGSAISVIASTPHVAKPTLTSRKKNSPRRIVKSSMPIRVGSASPPKSLTLEGQKRLYYAIAETLDLRQQCVERLPLAGDAELDETFKSVLGTILAPRLDSLGYTQAGKLDYWRMHLAAIEVFSFLSGARFPQVTAIDAEEGALRLFEVDEIVARAAAQAISNRSDGLVNMGVILSRLTDVEASAEAKSALDLLTGVQNGQRSTHVRFLVYCARALNLLNFEDGPNSPDLIRNPRLPDM